MASIAVRLRHAWQAFTSESKKAPYSWPGSREGQPQWSLGGAGGDFARYCAEGFEANALIYSAINYKARAITAARLCAYEGTIDEPVPLDPEDPLSKLLFRPNPSQSQAEMLQLMETYLNLTGDAYIHLDRRTATATPEAMRMLRPDRVRIIPEDGGIKGYVYLPEGKPIDDAVPMLPADVIHVKFPNPRDPLEGFGYGLSPITPLSQSGDVDNQITRFLKMFFERGALSSTLLKFDAPMTDDEIQATKQRWHEVYGGVDNWSEVTVLDNRGDLRQLGMPFNEMGFTTIDERNESRILAPFGVPGILVGSRGGLARSTYSNFEQARRQFWEDTFVPELQLSETEFDYYLAAPGSGVFLRYDTSKVPALRQDVFKQIDGAAKMWGMGVPAAQAFRAVGLSMSEIPDGDKAYIPGTVVEVGAPKPVPAIPAPGAVPALPAPKPEQAEPAADEQPTGGDASASEDTRKGILRPFPRRRAG